jgi:predicted alpha-1,6-mannanase (GH76 family)
LGLADRDTIVDPLLRALERYRSAHGYGPFPGDRARYYDDNAWIALDLLQLHATIHDDELLSQAIDLFGFLREGEGPAGGIYWVEGERSRNTCSTGPTAQVALRLFDATGDDRYHDFAERQMSFLDRQLRDERGLYRDHVAGDGSVEPTIWSYNQGTPMGASVLLARITGEKEWLDRALVTARATAHHFSGDGWWRQAPVFNAVYFRNLLALVATAPDAELLGGLDDYLERVWASARHRRTGLFVEGGIGSYDGNLTIDQAGLTQLFAFRSWPRERWAEIC